MHNINQNNLKITFVKLNAIIILYQKKTICVRLDQNCKFYKYTNKSIFILKSLKIKKHKNYFKNEWLYLLYLYNVCHYKQWSATITSFICSKFIAISLYYIEYESSIYNQ